MEMGVPVKGSAQERVLSKKIIFVFLYIKRYTIIVYYYFNKW
jgi:hypothetical protein